MPKEDRRIMFNKEEVYKAIYALCMQKDIPKPPPGVVTSVIEHEEDQSRIVVTLENPASHSAAQNHNIVEYSRDFIAAALMLFCRGCGIPLPKGAIKSVMLSGGEVILRVQIH